MSKLTFKQKAAFWSPETDRVEFEAGQEVDGIPAEWEAIALEEGWAELEGGGDPSRKVAAAKSAPEKK